MSYAWKRSLFLLQICVDVRLETVMTVSKIGGVLITIGATRQMCDV